MNLRNISIVVILLLTINGLVAQTIKGLIVSDNKVVPFANIQIRNIDKGVSTNENGDYIIKEVPVGSYEISISCIGMLSENFSVDVLDGINVFNFSLEPSVFNLDQVVVTGTKTFKRQTDSPVIVNIIDADKLESVQACNLAEGLNYQPGLRIEYDCQTCSYSQLRMNGLSGGYSQILINGKSIFSPLTGLYGMEQIPVNMIERIEIIRGGGSSLYGSSAVGGVVNVITRIPKRNSYSFGYQYSLINNSTDDNVFYGNATVLSDSKNSGATFFVNNRNREWYDHNSDNYSELPALRDNTFGINFFSNPTHNQKFEINFGSIHEYRYGGEMLDGPPHFSMQSEERVHDVLLANLDYQIDFNQGLSSFSSYLATQKTSRKHYTGIRPVVGSEEDLIHLQTPPYGTSLSITNQIGLQLNHSSKKLFGVNILTLGTEIISDNIDDEISSYNYLINQKVNSLGSFFQSDWSLTNKINLLSGVRIDKHSMLDDLVFSPRYSLMYHFKKKTQFRLSYSTGFRAPQAFDTDLHIAFAGGGISRVLLSDNLKEEKSSSVSASINYDKVAMRYLFGVTLEGFKTVLNNAFYLYPMGEDEFGELFEKRNGSGATVQGLTLEIRALYDGLEFESGYTLQNSKYKELVSYSDELVGTRNFLRSPNSYGYATIKYNKSSKFIVTANLVHTGVMNLIHLAGGPGQINDTYVESPIFNSIGLNFTYILKSKAIGFKTEITVGIKNITNSFQDDFDSFKNRDSNYFYGPILPRTFNFGLIFKSL